MCLGIPTEIIAITDEAKGIALVELANVRREVNISLLLEEMPIADLVGKWAIVHAGFAISLVDETEADSMLAMIATLESE